MDCSFFFEYCFTDSNVQHNKSLSSASYRENGKMNCKMNAIIIIIILMVAISSVLIFYIITIRLASISPMAILRG